MIEAYNQCYLPRAMRNLGLCFDAGMLRMKPEDFLRRFLDSDLARAWESGDPAYLAGRTGDELYTALSGETVDPDIHDVDLTKEFWCGQMLCYVQWALGLPFARLMDAYPLPELLKLAKERRDAQPEQIAALYHARLFPQPALKRLRLSRGLSQSQLALVSGVKIRSIRAYEQGDLDISRAQYDTLRALAGALCCTVEDLMS